MIFQNPSSFLFLLLIPLLFLFRKIGIFSRMSFPLTLSDWNGKTFALKGWNRKLFLFVSFLSNALILLAFVALVFACANPVMRHREKVFTSKGTEILFLLDTSPSMAAKDLSYMNSPITRLDAAKLSIKSIVESSEGQTFSLIAMASESAYVVPLTNNKKNFLERLDSVKVGVLGEGSAIGIGLCSAVYHLAATRAPKKCVILITDGENNAGSVHPETAARLAYDNGITLYVLGVGTRGTFTIEYVDPNTGKVRSGYYESGFDSASLEKIAFISGGKYFSVETLSSLSEAISFVSNRENVVQSFRLKTIDEYLYYKFLIAAAAMFVFAWILKRVCLLEIL